MTAAPDLEIRPLAASDEAKWHRLWKAYLAFYETERPEDIYASSFARMLSRAPNEYCGLIALLGGRPVGVAHYLFHRTNWEIGDTCYCRTSMPTRTCVGQASAGH